MLEINLTDGALSSAVREWLALDGLDSYDCIITDESGARLADTEHPLVVLYSSHGYPGSDMHMSLTERFGVRYAAVPLPLSFGALSSAVRTVLVSSVSPLEQNPAPSEKPCPIVSQDDRTVTYLGKTVALTEREFALFVYLYERANSTVSREELRANAWGDVPDRETNAVDVYISYLRRKTETLFGKGAIVSVRGNGYMLII